MSELLKNTIDKFYSFLIGEISILEFEKWVCDSPDLENELDEISYYDFISFGFKKSGAGTFDSETSVRSGLIPEIPDLSKNITFMLKCEAYEYQRRVWNQY